MAYVNSILTKGGSYGSFNIIFIQNEKHVNNKKSVLNTIIKFISLKHRKRG